MNSKRLFSITLPIAVIIAAVLGSKWIQASKPDTESRSEAQPLRVVEATRLKSTSYPVVLRSQGTVQPTVTNALVPEVGGSIVSLAPSFVVGGRFKAGDVLVELDRRDYDIALTQAEANLAQADARLQEQLALAERAVDEWRLLGRSGTPSALTLREPQLAAAKADKDAAEAQVSRARLDLERTRLTAPYDGIVGAKSVDVGQFVARGTSLGNIHALATADVTLPISGSQLAFLDLQSQPAVELQVQRGAALHRWPARLVRVEGLDSASQQLNVVAQVTNPYATGLAATADIPLRFGQFVQARITGKILNEVFVIPRGVLREGREVLLVDDQGRIERRPVTVAWTDDTQAAISDGLESEQVLVTTPMSTVANGTPVRAVVDGVSED